VRIRLRTALGSREERAAVTLCEFFGRFDLPRSLGELGMRPADSARIADEIVSQVPATTPSAPTADDIHRLLERALNGEAPSARVGVKSRTPTATEEGT
jgi:alcohol dehydrogenase class IV